MSQTKSCNLDPTLSQAESIGVVGSPSTSIDLTVDVIGTAVQKKLVGELSLIQFQQDGVPHYALGQITEIELKNVWHEDPTMRSLIRQRGRVDAVSERQDTHIGKMVLSAVFKDYGMESFDQSILGTVPATGTPIRLVTDNVLDSLLKPCRESLFYLGHVYGSTPKLPLWFKHFGNGPNGNGDAYHLGIFGKTGSGKTVLARMCLAGYARNKEMAIIIIDPQGEFAKELRKDAPNSPSPVPLREIIKTSGKKRAVLTLGDLILDRWDLFQELMLESEFFTRLSIPKQSKDNRENAIQLIVDALEKSEVKLRALSDRTSFDIAWKAITEQKGINHIYSGQASREKLQQAITDADNNEFYNRYWKLVTSLFAQRDGAKTIDQCLEWVLTEEQSNRPVLVIDLSAEVAEGVKITEKIRNMILRRLFSGIKLEAEKCYKDDKSLNTLVLIDEAHRLAPRHISQSDEAGQIRNILIDAVRTTRKYGLGWMFISQTMSSLDTEIIQQLRILFVGFGLSLGQEFQALQQTVGSKSPALDLYQTFRDPNSSFSRENRQYPFMTVGPVSPLSFSGTPLFLSVFNSREEFLKANGYNFK